MIDGGYIEASKYHYYQTDHLANNRVVADNTGAIMQSTHYYPFGMVFAEGTGEGKQPYKYNGKELDAQHGLNTYDYSARYMDPGIGRFSSVDPLAEKYYSWSPYAYVANNPMRFIDPTGMFLDDYFNLKGGYLGSDNDPNSSKVRVMDQLQWDLNKNVSGSIDPAIGQGIAPLHSLTNIPKDASLGIYQHYNLTDLPLTDTSNDWAGTGDTGMSFRYRRSTKNAVDIGVDVAGLKKTKVSDHIHEIRSIMVHENKHYSDFKAWGFDTYTSTPLSIREQRAILTEMNHDSFSKMRPGMQKASQSYGEQHGLLYNKTLPQIKVQQTVIFPIIKIK